MAHVPVACAPLVLNILYYSLMYVQLFGCEEVKVDELFIGPIGENAEVEEISK